MDLASRYCHPWCSTTGSGEAAGDNAAAVETGDTDSTDDGAQDGEGATDDTGPTTTQSTETTLSTAGNADIDQSDAPEVLLLDPGAEPRTQLRMSLADGQSEVMVMNQTQEIVQTIDEVQVPSAGPVPMIITMDLRVGSAGSNLFEVSSEVSDVAVGPGVDPALAAEIQTAINGIVGMTTLAVMDDRGRLLSSAFDGTTGLDPTLVSTMEQLLANNQAANPLPEEPVGVGAQWMTTQNFMTNGLDITQTATYELISIEDTVVTLSVAVDQSVPAGSVMSVAGQSASIIDWQMDGSGTLVLDLTRVAPTSTMESAAIQSFEFTEGGQTANLVQSINMSLSVTPA